MGTLTLPVWAIGAATTLTILTLWALSTALRLMRTDRDYWRAAAITARNLNRELNDLYNPNPPDEQ